MRLRCLLGLSDKLFERFTRRPFQQPAASSSITLGSELERHTLPPRNPASPPWTRRPAQVALGELDRLTPSPTSCAALLPRCFHTLAEKLDAAPDSNGEVAARPDYRTVALHALPDPVFPLNYGVTTGCRGPASRSVPKAVSHSWPSSVRGLFSPYMHGFPAITLRLTNSKKLFASQGVEPCFSGYEPDVTPVHLPAKRTCWTGLTYRPALLPRAVLGSASPLARCLTSTVCSDVPQTRWGFGPAIRLW